MTFDVWVKANLGKGINYDGVYGVQCVDLIKHYVKNVLGITPQSIGNAIEYYRKRNISAYLTNNFVWYSNTPSFIPQKGDICVFTSKSGHGHVSIATGEGTTRYFYSYDQNYPKAKHEPMTKIKHTYGSFLGVLRPKNQSNIIVVPAINVGQVLTLTANVKVREGAGINAKQKLRSQLTADGKKNAKAGVYAVLKAGTKVTVQEVDLKGNDIWIRIPSGWIAVYYQGKAFVK